MADRGFNLDEIKPEAGVASVEGVDYNVPLTASQKLNLMNIRLRRVNLQRQIAELQTQEAKMESYFHSELMRVAIVNKIDMDKFVLDDSLTIKPLAATPPFGQRR